MTGFGKATLQLPTKKINVEIKSLNSKGLDLNTKLPSIYREMELKLRNEIASKLERGKIDFLLFIETTTEQTSNKVNVEVVKNYINQLKQVVNEGYETEMLKMAIRMPDAMKVEREELDANEWATIQNVIQEALENIRNFRQAEGQSLDKEFQLRISNIRQYLGEAIALDPERIQNIKDKLQTAIAELKVNVDENRFEQELIYYLEKLDVTEERVRLNNHLDYFLETMKTNEGNGRKLGFITQEIGREINTLGSKANHAGMQKLVVMMKDELEKIKEQVLNVL
jgi:uncharacterized protein (TIGR00255 family)